MENTVASGLLRLWALKQTLEADWAVAGIKSNIWNTSRLLLAFLRRRTRYNIQRFLRQPNYLMNGGDALSSEPPSP